MPGIPSSPQRIVLVNPTRYLGNLLIAGGLIQDFAKQCRDRGIAFALVIDQRYVPLLQSAFCDLTLIAYPRSEIAAARGVKKAVLYLTCLRRIRAFQADLAFNIEEDSVSHRLTQLSGAAFRLGCSPLRHRRGYHCVLPVEINQRPPGQAHRWHSFDEVFRTLGLEGSKPGYVQLAPAALAEGLQQRLQDKGIDFSRSLAVLHTGATKAYKLWPHAHFAELIDLLEMQGHQVVLIGAGKDAASISSVLEMLAPALASRVVNLLNALTLEELASLLSRASLVVGNDSGPFHLAAALGVPGVVIFGPTTVDIWAPLSDRVVILQDSAACHPECTRRRCLLDYRCLWSITPAKVMNSLALLSGSLVDDKADPL